MAALRYTREVLASHPDGVIAVRLTCDKPGRLSFTVKLNSGNLPGKVSAPDSRTLALVGQAREKKHSDGSTGVSFACQVRVLATKGKITAREDCLEVEGADAVTLLIAANTSFHNPAPESLCRSQLETAARKTYRKLREAHVADHRRLFRRRRARFGRGRGGAATYRSAAGRSPRRRR